MGMEKEDTQNLSPGAMCFLVRLSGAFVHKFKLSKFGLYAVYESRKELPKDHAMFYSLVVLTYF